MWLSKLSELHLWLIIHWTNTLVTELLKFISEVSKTPKDLNIKKLLTLVLARSETLRWVWMDSSWSRHQSSSSRVSRASRMFRLLLLELLSSNHEKNQKSVPICKPQSRQSAIGFFSSRPNWDPFLPLTHRQVCPLPLVPGDTHSLAGEGLGRGTQFGRGDIHCGTVGTVCTLCCALSIS